MEGFYGKKGGAGELLSKEKGLFLAPDGGGQRGLVGTLRILPYTCLFSLYQC